MNPFDLDDDAQSNLYGPWVARKPEDAAELFKGYRGTWWISGGWALEAFTGESRKHGDVDLYVLRSELRFLRQQLADSQDLWALTPEGALLPLIPENNPDGSAEELLPEGTRSLWTRKNGRQPWEFDIGLSATDGEEWVYQHDESVRRPMSESLWAKDGILYVKPEMALLSKARKMSERDVKDFEVALPLLDSGQRAWLRGTIGHTLGDNHPWLEQLDG